MSARRGVPARGMGWLATAFVRCAGAAALAGSPTLAQAATPTDAFAPDRLLRAEVRVRAPIDSVWAAWTTERGVTSFFAPGCHVEPHVDGLYEIYFDPAAPPGQRGADSLHILTFEPPRRLAFTWNAPLAQPYVRGQRTMVVVELVPAGQATRVRLTQSGWGTGGDWDRAYDYFARAWGAQVLPFLMWRFEHGSVDWTHPPDVKPLTASMKQQLVPITTRHLKI